MELIGSHSGTSSNDFLGLNLEVLDLEAGTHNLVFVSSNSTNPQTIFYFEVLGDFSSQEDRTYMGELKKLDVNKGDRFNYGDISLAVNKEQN
mmetsp:Transcript_36085/g.35065  ORF Transcript_36085/g.35065 Transcript_36085/m.35065 type:complete len:92 (-) Transcript_36085:55-330(-)|eukprot:CAMPEP_0170551756 /NCGR_PEP_ID=MMETSP0211-20121228/9752_1 /TAXON_ID=311385 /ORGANISM="Pseudokeronopsis sp., Strain OXSARD2" /LENGTH=91 /DNA_ID=CAMNT_0010859119 /DNA_START=508 /DNA_END=783 /DNA_ORIENTATION=-